MDSIIEQVLGLFHGEAGNSGLLQNILLILIWLNIRSVKVNLNRLEEGHDHRLSILEVDSEKSKSRLTVLEANKGT